MKEIELDGFGCPNGPNVWRWRNCLGATGSELMHSPINWPNGWNHHIVPRRTRCFIMQESGLQVLVMASRNSLITRWLPMQGIYRAGIPHGSALKAKVPNSCLKCAHNHRPLAFQVGSPRQKQALFYNSHRHRTCKTPGPKTTRVKQQLTWKGASPLAGPAKYVNIMAFWSVFSAISLHTAEVQV